MTDPDESVFGLNGGLLTVFTVNRKIDIRLEAVGHLLRDAIQPEADHRLCCGRLEVLTGMAGFPPDLWGRAGSAAVGFSWWG